MKRNNAFDHGKHILQEVSKQKKGGRVSLGSLTRLPPEIRPLLWQYVTLEDPVKPHSPGRLKAFGAWVPLLGSCSKAVRDQFHLVSRQVCIEACYALKYYSLFSAGVVSP